MTRLRSPFTILWPTDTRRGTCSYLSRPGLTRSMKEWNVVEVSGLSASRFDSSRRKESANVGREGDELIPISDMFPYHIDQGP